MGHIAMEELRETLHRVAKIDLDDGEALDADAALTRLKGHTVVVRAGAEIRFSERHQIALLTTVNILRRFALGGVFVSGELAGCFRGKPLPDLVAALGGFVGEGPSPAAPQVVVGTVREAPERALRTTFAGWRGGVVSQEADRVDEATGTAPAAVLAGALAAAEAFAMLRGDVLSGRRTLGLSLWRPDAGHDWRSSESDGPPLEALPNHLWVLGLGHLGQAFLWALAACPYRDPYAVRLVLQDIDEVTGSTDSTSILTHRKMIRRRKTRAVAEVMESKGFQTSIIERPFDGAFQRRSDDPAILVCGVDNGLARSQLEEPGFPLIVEAGIGRRAEDFRGMLVHTLPATRKARDIWRTGGATASPRLNVPGYQRLRENGADLCGLTLLRETAVGAPFVGTVAATLMLAQILRVLAGDRPDALVELDLRSLKSRRAIPNTMVPPFNPGYVAC